MRFSARWQLKISHPLLGLTWKTSENLSNPTQVLGKQGVFNPSSHPLLRQTRKHLKISPTPLKSSESGEFSTLPHIPFWDGFFVFSCLKNLRSPFASPFSLQKSSWGQMSTGFSSFLNFCFFVIIEFLIAIYLPSPRFWFQYTQNFGVANSY